MEHPLYLPFALFFCFLKNFFYSFFLFCFTLTHGILKWVSHANFQDLFFLWNSIQDNATIFLPQIHIHQFQGIKKKCKRYSSLLIWEEKKLRKKKRNMTPPHSHSLFQWKMLFFLNFYFKKPIFIHIYIYIYIYIYIHTHIWLSCLLILKDHLLLPNFDLSVRITMEWDITLIKLFFIAFNNA